MLKGERYSMTILDNDWCIGAHINYDNDFKKNDLIIFF